MLLAETESLSAAEEENLFYVKKTHWEKMALIIASFGLNGSEGN